MSFQEVSITVACYNEASGEFYRIASDASRMAADVRASSESMGAGFRSALSDLTTLGVGASAIANLAVQLGITNREQVAWLSTLGSAVSAAAAVGRALQLLTSITSVATWVQNSLNISYATFLALTGVGIAVIISAAAAMWYFTSQMNAATSSVRNYNTAVSEIPTYSRSIQRAGEEEALRRRGID